VAPPIGLTASGGRTLTWRQISSLTNHVLCVCREEKIKRALRQQKHASAASETASDRSAELKADSVAFPLAAAPERGILKKGSSQGSITGSTKSASRLARPLLATSNG